MIKVAVWGTGMMGQGLLGFILDRPKDIDLVGAIVTNPAKEGKTVGELLGRECDVKMTTDFAAVLAKKPDVVCICTQSNLHEITAQVEPSVRAGGRPVHRRALASVGERPRVGRADRRARPDTVSRAGTGINPGFVLDAHRCAQTVCLRVTASKHRA